MSEPEVKITRDTLLRREHEVRIQEAERLGLIQRLPEEARLASRDRALRAFGDDPVWVFGYGSLIWNPAIHFVERRPARIYGLRRRFCIEMPMGRGTPEQPGRMLALDRGGCCDGIAYRIAPEAAEQELDLLWRREMLASTYRPVMVRCHGADGVFRAVTFAMNRRHERFCTADFDTVARSIAVAEGFLGSCVEYLDSTRQHLREVGLVDGYLERMARRVAELRSAG
ncbi:MAG: gamma-glutamylcyclotransferase [Pseudomonadota bacterium]|nr:gamma-glutamylcyclotransferase [Pseudomonadota bacterium]